MTHTPDASLRQSLSEDYWFICNLTRHKNKPGSCEVKQNRAQGKNDEHKSNG